MIEKIKCPRPDLNDLEKAQTAKLVPFENCSTVLSDRFSPVFGRDDFGNQCSFVNLSVEANLKMAPSIFHGCNYFN